MARILLAIDYEIEARLIEGIVSAGHEIVDRVSGGLATATAVERLRPDVVIMQGGLETLTPRSLAVCQRFGVRAIALVATDLERRNAESLEVAETVDASVAWEELEVRLASEPTPREQPARPQAFDPLPTGRRRERRETRAELVAVWGPHGAPGASTVAAAIAASAAQLGRRVLLIDADSYGGSLAPMLGITDEAPGFAAACRLAGSGSLTIAELERIAVQHRAGPHEFLVLTGIANPSRWPELSKDRVLAVLEKARSLVDLVIVDVGFNLERDDEVASDPFAPRRAAATLAALEACDRIVAVADGQAVGLQRFLRARLELLELVGATRIDIIVNRVRAEAVGLGAASQITHVLQRFGGIDESVLVPLDQAACDRALLAAQPVTHASARSALARSLVGYTERTFAPARPQPATPIAREPGIRRSWRGRRSLGAQNS